MNWKLRMVGREKVHHPDIIVPFVATTYCQSPLPKVSQNTDVLIKKTVNTTFSELTPLINQPLTNQDEYGMIGYILVGRGENPMSDHMLSQHQQSER